MIGRDITFSDVLWCSVAKTLHPESGPYIPWCVVCSQLLWVPALCIVSDEASMFTYFAATNLIRGGEIVELLHCC